MLCKDMCGRTRFYVKGQKENLTNFTIDLTWYHSAIASIGSVNDGFGDDVFVLNLVVNETCKEEYAEKQLRKMCEKHKVYGFATWKEYDEEVPV